LAVVELQRRDLALRIDGPIVLAGLGLLFLVVDLLGLGRDARLLEHDMRRQRAGAGGEVQLHSGFSSLDSIAGRTITLEPAFSSRFSGPATLQVIGNRSRRRLRRNR